MPPAGLWLVHAKAVKVVSKDGPSETTEWVILYAYTGGPELRGKSFTLAALTVLGTTGDRVRGYRAQTGDESIWWIKKRREGGGLVGELDAQTLERFDPECAFPASINPLDQRKALAGMIEKLNDCERDSERVRLLIKHVVADSPYVSTWSLWWLRSATSRLKVPAFGAKKALDSAKKSKMTIASQAVGRAAKHAVSASDFYNLACSLSLCVRLAAVESDQESSAQGAVGFFKQAIENGWDDVERIKNDSDLDTVRARDDFKKLLAELEARKAPQSPKMKQ